MAINFIRVSSTGSVPSTLPLMHDKELEKDLLQALYYTDDADLLHSHVLIPSEHVSKVTSSLSAEPQIPWDINIA